MAGGVGVSTILAILWLALLKKRTKQKPPHNNLDSQESRRAKISIKEVHLATDNLSASNFIGQGVAGKKKLVFKNCCTNFGGDKS